MDDLLIKYSQLGDIFDYLSIGVMVLTPDRKIISLNKSAEIITGYRESDLLGEERDDGLLAAAERQVLFGVDGVVGCRRAARSDSMKANLARRSAAPVSPTAFSFS